MTVLVSDSFNRADSTATLGTTDSYTGGTAKTWSYNANGIWGIYSNGAYIVDYTTYPIVSYVASGASDVKVTAKVNRFNNSSAMVARYDPANSSGIIIGTSGKIETFTGQTFNTLQQNDIFVDGDIVKTVLSGSSITVYRNDTQIMQVTSTFNQDKTNHGLGNWQHSGGAPSFPNGAYWDYFIVEDLNIGVNIGDMFVIQHKVTGERFMMNLAPVTDDPRSPNPYVIPKEFIYATDQTPVPYLFPKSVKWEASSLNPLDR